MPISQRACSGYRSLEDVTLPLGPLTAFVGPNGSGKTSLLRAMIDSFKSLRYQVGARWLHFRKE